MKADCAGLQRRVTGAGRRRGPPPPNARLPPMRLPPVAAACGSRMLELRPSPTRLELGLTPELSLACLRKVSCCIAARCGRRTCRRCGGGGCWACPGQPSSPALMRFVSLRLHSGRMEASWSVEQLGPAKGRGVVARRAFKPGDLVLEDRAFAQSAVMSELGSVCDCCLAPCRQPLRCARQGPLPLAQNHARMVQRRCMC